MHIRTWFPLADTIDRAFECVYWEGAGDEQVEAFASHWGGLELEQFQRALEAGDGDEQVLAIFALGLTATAEAANRLAPFLAHTHRKQRWASAICLGLMKDARAFPALEGFLLDGLDFEEYRRASQAEDWDHLFELHWCDVFRWHGVQLLESWDAPSLIPTLKHAFAALWRIQQYPRLFGSFPVWNYDVFAYALGQRGDFTVLEGLEVPREHRNTALVYLALGHLRAKASQAAGLTGLPSPIAGLQEALHSSEALQQAVARVLGESLGLSLAEQMDCLTHFHRYQEMRETYGYVGGTSSNLAEDSEEEEDEELEEEEPAVRETSPLCTYQGHTARIQSIAWSPESTHLVSGSEDSTARVWKSTTGETVTLFSGHRASVNLVAWSPRGPLIASGGSDGIVCIWHAWTGEHLQTYHGHQAWIWGGLAWSPDGTRLASASLDRTIQVWDARSGQTLLTYRGHTGMVASLTWSPDGRSIASGGGYPECAIQVWDAQTGACQLTYREHQRDEHKQRPLFGRVVQEPDDDLEEWLRDASSVHGLAWSPDGTRLASAGLRMVCRVWDARSGETLIASDRTAGPLSWSPESMLLSSSRFLHQVDLWDATTNQIALSYRTREMFEIKAVCWSPDGRFLAASGKQTTPSSKEIVQVWKVTM